MPVGAEFILLCLPALPPAIALAFDANGILVGHAYLGNPHMTAPPAHIPAAIAAPVKPKVALPDLPIIGKVDGSDYEIGT